jgi:hypothetical protein
VRGRSAFYARRGAYPVAIVFSCESHRLEAVSDPDLGLATCSVCERQFDAASVVEVAATAAVAPAEAGLTIKCRSCADRGMLVRRVRSCCHKVGVLSGKSFVRRAHQQ